MDVICVSSLVRGVDRPEELKGADEEQEGEVVQQLEVRQGPVHDEDLDGVLGGEVLQIYYCCSSLEHGY